MDGNSLWISEDNLTTFSLKVQKVILKVNKNYRSVFTKHKTLKLLKYSSLVMQDSL